MFVELCLNRKIKIYLKALSNKSGQKSKHVKTFTSVLSREQIYIFLDRKFFRIIEHLWATSSIDLA